MRFTITQEELSRMLNEVSKKMPRTRMDNLVKLSACGPRVFVESNQTVAGKEALVLVEGACTLPRILFRNLVKSYAGKVNLTIEANANYIQIETSRFGVLSYSDKAVQPAKFQEWPVTDTWVAQSHSPLPTGSTKAPEGLEV